MISAKNPKMGREPFGERLKIICFAKSKTRMTLYFDLPEDI